MSKNYEAIHHIREQLTSYDDGLSDAIQKLFDIEDQRKENQGCVIDSVVASLIFAKFGIKSELHLGEMCADGIHDGYHCWLTVDGKIIDIGIYGNLFLPNETKDIFCPNCYTVEKFVFSKLLRQGRSIEHDD